MNAAAIGLWTILLFSFQVNMYYINMVYIVLRLKMYTNLYSPRMIKSWMIEQNVFPSIQSSSSYLYQQAQAKKYRLRQ